MANAETSKPTFAPEEDFTGRALVELVCAIEAAIGTRSAGCTPLGRAVISLCEAAVDADRLRAEAAIAEEEAREEAAANGQFGVGA